jgi:hypothetical protein
MIWIWTGGRPSNGAKALASQPGFRRLRKGKFIKPHHIIVNWGSSKPADWVHDHVLNESEPVRRASNKFHAFAALSCENVSTVPWTANKELALEWLSDGSTVVVRNVLTGHSGDGIIIVEKGNLELPDAPLYTKYIFKVREFRVHATRDKVIDTQQKVRDPDQEPKTWKIRSHANGFIFQRGNIQANQARDDLAVQAVKVLGLDFGAVDIVEDKKGNFYVLEVNTAPGLEGQTIESYTQALKELAVA